MSQRTERVAELLRSFLGAELMRLADPRLQFVTVTAVDMSPDLKNARIFWSSFAKAGQDAGFLPEADVKNIGNALNHAGHLLKRRIGAELELRYIPRLHFVYDESLQRGSKIDELLRKVGL